MAAINPEGFLFLKGKEEEALKVRDLKATTRKEKNIQAVTKTLPERQ